MKQTAGRCERHPSSEGEFERLILSDLRIDEPG
jgi:hypothetical protein